MNKTEQHDSGNIMLVITTLTFGGAETQVVRLATELKARGWRVSVVCLVDPTAYVGQLRSQDIAVYSLGMWRGIADVRAIFRLRALVNQLRPGVVHCHMYHANILGRITRLFCRMPVLVCTAHNLRETSEKGGPTWHKELLYRATDWLADTTTIICSAAFERYLRVHAVPLSKLRLIPNGVDTALFSPSQERRNRARKALGLDSEFVWLAVGRMVPQKDYPTLLRAIERLVKLERLGPGRCTLLVAGNGPLEAELRQQATQRGLDTVVRFCGAREDIVDLYSAADAFVMSSEFEGLSAALLEATAMGLPAVVTQVGGNPDVVLDGVNGYLVSPNNPGALAAAMSHLMTAPPEVRQRFSEAARRICTQRYRFEVVTQLWLTLYAEFPPPAWSISWKSQAKDENPIRNYAG